MSKLPEVKLGIISQAVGKETVLFLHGDTTVKHLGEEATYVLECCREQASREDTEKGLSERFGVSDPSQRLTNHLVTFAEFKILASEEMNRRDFGVFCTKVAVPAVLVATLSVPVAAMSCPTTGHADCSTAACGSSCQFTMSDPCDAVCVPRFMKSDATVATPGNIGALLASDSPEPQNCRGDNARYFAPPLTCVDARNDVTTPVGTLYKCCP